MFVSHVAVDLFEGFLPPRDCLVLTIPQVNCPDTCLLAYFLSHIDGLLQG
jgi:hypothetical protein